MTEPTGLLGPGVEHQGDLSMTGPVRIEGSLIGRLVTDDLVHVCEGASVRGGIDAAQILIEGTVRGTLHARERCTLLATAVVQGRLVTPWLDVRNGARLKAEVRVDRGRT